MFEGLAVYMSLCLIFIWLGSTWRKHVARYGLITDIVIHGTCQLMLGGAHQGRIAVLFGCLLFSFTLMAYRRFRCSNVVS